MIFNFKIKGRLKLFRQKFHGSRRSKHAERKQDFALAVYRLVRIHFNQRFLCMYSPQMPQRIDGMRTQAMVVHIEQSFNTVDSLQALLVRSKLHAANNNCFVARITDPVGKIGFYGIAGLFENPKKTDQFPNTQGIAHFIKKAERLILAETHESASRGRAQFRFFTEIESENINIGDRVVH
ncbi:chaperonin GroEL [Corchorus olitorius]|uniref:Chaperonin GroEL n=1 Tax=Corchorus olitorius TaxID=93759 RepID=A0A1R3L1S5_9ROSI|nr:chaperonin GroEL [Corchorus olitorius]